MANPIAFDDWRPHPWHGISTGKEPPGRVTAFIEITPFDLVKYEIDKVSGYLWVDRPQHTSSLPPTLYGFIPRTFCGRRVAGISDMAEGDEDPLDICVISERPINRGGVLLNTRVVGGIRTVDHDAADDKIIAVLEKDDVFGGAVDLSDLPAVLIDRLRHYFATYKTDRGGELLSEVHETYAADRARQVVEAARADYEEAYPRK